MKSLNERQMKILHSISKLEILTRSQIQYLHDTKSVRNTNITLQKLNVYLNHIRLKENAYYLSKKGMELTGTKNQFRYNNQIIHKLMRNNAYIYFKPTKWQHEVEFKVGKTIIVPDAFFYSGSSYKFLEVDNTQKWKVNSKKIEQYQKMMETQAFQNQYGKFPILVWVVRYELRKQKLQDVLKDSKLPYDIYLHDEINLTGGF